MKRLLFFNLLILILLNPYVPPVILGFFKIDSSILRDYPFFFWSFLAVSLTLTGILALYRFLKVDELTVPENNRSPIKGLQPFLAEDAGVFTRLQRQDILEQCSFFIQKSNYRFGILCGESGCGKTSFIKAGLIPAISGENSKYQCVYIKFSNEFVVNSVRNAFINQLNMPIEDTKDKDFISLLNKAREITSGKILILIFDQFEQFFVHRKSKEKRKPFIDIITDWYRNYSKYPMKILISMRNDLMGYLYEFQLEMEYPLIARENYFFLEKFTPNQGFEILKVIAELESLPIEEDFVKNIAERELPGKQDGLISPIDIQIFALMIREHRVAEQEAFTRKAFETFGGVEGLLLRFLHQQLDSPKNRNRAALKILILLTDFELYVRSGLKTIKFIHPRIGIKEASVQNILDWLERLGLVQKVTNKSQRASYELSHEKLIAPLQRLAGALIFRVEKTNQILNQRVNEWIGNDRSKKYLLNLTEFFRIKRYSTFIAWGSNKEEKERLIFESEKKLARQALQIVAILAFLSSPFIWWLTPTGQIWQIKRDLVNISKRANDFNQIYRAVTSLLIAEEYRKAMKIIHFIDEPEKKARLYLETSKTAFQLGDKIRSKRFLQLAYDNIKELESSREQVEFYIELARESYKNTYKNEATAILKHSIKISKQIKNEKVQADLLLDISSVFLDIYIRKQSLTTLIQAEQLILERNDNFYKLKGILELVKRYVLLNEMEKAKSLLEEAQSLPRKIGNYSYKSTAYMDIARTLQQIAIIKRDAVYLEEAASRAKDIKFSGDKSTTLRNIALASATLYEQNNQELFLDIADRVADEINVDADKTICFFTLAKIALEDSRKKRAEEFLKSAWKSAEYAGSYESRSGLLRDIARAYIKLNEKEAAYSILKRAIIYSRRIRYDYEKAAALKEIAGISYEIGDTDKASEFINKAIHAAKAIREDIYKCSALSDIATIAAMLDDKTRAREILTKAAGVAGVIQYESYRSSSLRYIAETALRISQGIKQDQVFFAMALDYIRKIKSHSDKAAAYEEVSLYFRQKQDLDRAEHFLKRAFFYAKKIEVEQSKYSIIKDLAKFQIELGNWYTARAITRIIEKDDPKLEAYSLFLRTYMEQQNPDYKKIKQGKDLY